jgi:hypothetical protein
MAKENGWWKIEYTVEPSEFDLRHIAMMIEEGYTEGEIIIDEFEEDNSED